jgi:hypothetical protein
MMTELPILLAEDPDNSDSIESPRTDSVIFF